MVTRCDELFQGPGDVRGVIDCFMAGSDGV